MSAVAVAAVIGALADEPWMPRITHWEIATTDEVWGAHAALDCKGSGPAFRELHALADKVGGEVVVDGHLVSVTFDRDRVLVKVWWLRPFPRWVTPEMCATCSTKLGDGVRFVRLGEGDREAPVICVSCRDRMQAEFVAAALDAAAEREFAVEAGHAPGERNASESEAADEPVAHGVQCGDCGAYGDVDTAEDGLLYLFPSGQIGHPRRAEGGESR